MFKDIEKNFTVRIFLERLSRNRMIPDGIEFVSCG
jgi:hypothetical protein